MNQFREDVVRLYNTLVLHDVIIVKEVPLERLPLNPPTKVVSKTKTSLGVYGVNKKCN